MGEPLSPELALVDPELAARAREALPDRLLADERPRDEEVRERRSYATFARVAGLLALLASLTLNVNLLAERRPNDQEQAAAGPNTGAVKAATAVRSHVRPTRTSPSPRKLEVTRSPRKVPVTSPLRWRRSAGATGYDVVIWQGHRRVLDVWTTRPQVDLSALSCAQRRKLAKNGRYLWFVYPMFRSKAPTRFGALVHWGVLPPAVAISCGATPGVPSRPASGSRRP